MTTNITLGNWEMNPGVTLCDWGMNPIVLPKIMRNAIPVPVVVVSEEEELVVDPPSQNVPVVQR